jgi:hypothetical protein
MALYILTLAEIKAQLGISDTVDDNQITLWLEGLQGRIATHCGRALLEAENRVEILSGDVTELLLHCWPIESISEIVVNIDQDWTDAGSILASDDYLVNHERGAIRYARGMCRWPEGYRSIRVTYSGGLLSAAGAAANSYVDADHVQAVKRALLIQGTFEWRNRKTLGISQVSQGGASIQQGAQVALALVGQTLLPEVETTLLPLRRIV